MGLRTFVLLVLQGVLWPAAGVRAEQKGPQSPESPTAAAEKTATGGISSTRAWKT